MAFQFNTDAPAESVVSPEVEMLEDMRELGEVKAEIESLIGELPEMDAIYDNLTASIQCLTDAKNKDEAVLTLNIDHSIESLLSVAEDKITAKAALEGLGDKLKEWWKKFVDFIKRLCEKIKNFFVNLFSGKKDMAKTTATALTSALNRSKKLNADFVKEVNEMCESVRKNNATVDQDGTAFEFMAKNKPALENMHDRFQRVYHTASELMKSPLSDSKDKEAIAKCIEEARTLEKETTEAVESVAKQLEESNAAAKAAQEALVHVVVAANAAKQWNTDDCLKRIQKSPEEIARAEQEARWIEERVGKIRSLIEGGKTVFDWSEGLLMTDAEKKAVAEGGAEIRSFKATVSRLMQGLASKFLQMDTKAATLVGKAAQREVKFVNDCRKLSEQVESKLGDAS